MYFTKQQKANSVLLSFYYILLSAIAAQWQTCTKSSINAFLFHTHREKLIFVGRETYMDLESYSYSCLSHLFLCGHTQAHAHTVKIFSGR